MLLKEFYIYVLVDHEGIYRYIGKANTSYNRPQRHFKKSSNSTVRENINNKWKVEILFRSTNEKEVMDMERLLIYEYKNTLYNKTRGGEGGPTRDGDGNSIILKNIHTGQILHFESQVKAARYLNIHKSLVSQLVKGKRTHMKGQWVLDHTDPSSISPYRSRKKGYKVEKLYKPIKIYDNHTKKYINFNSQKQCADFLKCSTGNVTNLFKKKIQTLKCGRYSLNPVDGKVTKSTQVFDILEQKIWNFFSRKEMSIFFGININSVSSLMTGKQKILHGRFTLIEKAST